MNLAKLQVGFERRMRLDLFHSREETSEVFGPDRRDVREISVRAVKVGITLRQYEGRLFIEGFRAVSIDARHRQEICKLRLLAEFSLVVRLYQAQKDLVFHVGRR